MCQYWASRIFAKQVVVTANTLVAGWGNMGGGVAQLVVGSVLFPLFKLIYQGDASQAWRTVCIVPGRWGSFVLALPCSANASAGCSYTPHLSVPIHENSVPRLCDGCHNLFHFRRCSSWKLRRTQKTRQHARHFSGSFVPKWSRQLEYMDPLSAVRLLLWRRVDHEQCGSSLF